ncbi:hypothetical protein M0802_008796 [Mischocyttarus mexicanus]|nr:hypothetical protein M0802_008796 [Mischocyttarus mexicanus]
MKNTKSSGTAVHSTAQRCTEQHNTARHDTARHGRAQQHAGPSKRNECSPLYFKVFNRFTCRPDPRGINTGSPLSTSYRHDELGRSYNYTENNQQLPCVKQLRLHGGSRLRKRRVEMKEEKKEKEEEEEVGSWTKGTLEKHRMEEETLEGRGSWVVLEDTTRTGGGGGGGGDGSGGASSRLLNNFERGPWVRRCSDIPDTLPGPSGVLLERFTYIVALVAESAAAAALSASLPTNIDLS